MAPIAYVPIAQNPSPYAWAPVIVRSSTSSAGITSSIGQRVQRLNPAIAIEFIELKTRIRERLIGERMIAWLAGAFGILATALVAVGLYGIIAYLAASRRNEIGIRLSLGSHAHADRGAGASRQSVAVGHRTRDWSAPCCRRNARCGRAVVRPDANGCSDRGWEPHVCSRQRARLRPLFQRGARRGSVPTSRFAVTEWKLKHPTKQNRGHASKGIAIAHGGLRP